MQTLGQWLIETWNMGVAMAPWLLFGFFVSGLLHSFMPMGWIRKHLANEGLGGVFKAALVGTPLPICSCGVIPVANWLRKEGASRGSTMSFLVSTPETGIDSILATMAMMGGLFAGLRPAVAILSGILIGILVMRIKTPAPSGVVTASSCSGDDCCSATPEGEVPSQLRVRAKGFWGRMREAMHYGFVELVEDVAKWLLIGLIVGGAITVFVPTDLLASAGQWGKIGSYVAVLLLGIPLYVCATGSIPIAAALMAKGVSPGAALVFLIVGPATNVATIAFVGGTFGRKVLALYLGVIASVAVAVGLLLDVFIPEIAMSHIHHSHGAELAQSWEILSAIILFALLIPKAIRKLIQWFPKPKPKETSMPQSTLKIPSISCGNCARHIDKIARSVPGVLDVKVDVATKLVVISGQFDESALQLKLAEEGYPPE